MRSALLFSCIVFNLLSTLSSSPPYSCDSTSYFKFCNKKSLPIPLRVNSLISLLTLDEKISQLVNSAPAIPRLGIPQYEWWSEALHGVSNAGRGVHFSNAVTSATSFPQVILTAASFDASLWYRVGQAIGKEARALYNAGLTTGMTFWAPNINVFRDPRWGRGQETPGEDPMVAGRYATYYVRGIQGDSFQGGILKGHLQASACCKHFTAYDLDRWNGVTRYVFDARVTPQDLADTYQPPFQSCVEQGRASGIMCSYNRVNGVPSCANYNLLTRTARGQWGFHGYVTSDCDAVSIIHDNQGYAKTPEDAVADVLKAGMDVNCGTYLKDHTKAAVMAKKLPEWAIDRALYNLFSVRMRLGLFDGNPNGQMFGNIRLNQICSAEHEQLALDAARNGVVLLKNAGRTLPLSRRSILSLAVIGPNGNSPKTLLGNYAGPPCKTVTPLQGLQRYVGKTRFLSGCDSVQCLYADTSRAAEIARGVDRVVLVMGLDQTQEREDFDRTTLLLPGQQRELILEVAKTARNPIVLVLLCGGPVDVQFAIQNPKIGGIIWGGYPGQSGGTALAEIIFGDHNPGGRLPVTWYPQEFTRVPMTDMRMRPDLASGYPGRTYRFYRGKPVFRFGYGLSYSRYTYSFRSVSRTEVYLNQSAEVARDSASSRRVTVADVGEDMCESRKFVVPVRVANEGKMGGKHPVLLFARPAIGGNGRAVSQLVGFESVVLGGGERGEIGFEVSPCEHLSHANEDGIIVLEEGAHWLFVGDAQHPVSVFL